MAVYTANEAWDRYLGQVGCGFEDGTDAVNPTAPIIAIHFVSNTVFTLLNGNGTSQYIGTTNQLGDVLDGTNIFTAGTTIYGSWNNFTLASGSVVYYLG